MAKRVFFSFHYQDVIDFRANVVRNHWVTKLNREDAGYFDASLWESVKRQGNTALKRLINSGLDNTSVTCVLIGSDTYQRPWVRYEILKSFIRGNNLFGVHINNIRGRDGFTKDKGPNPFDNVGVTFSQDGSTATLWQFINGAWNTYGEIDGSATFYFSDLQPQYRGNGYALSHFYQVYDWVSNDGFTNFSNWVG